MDVLKVESRGDEWFTFPPPPTPALAWEYSAFNFENVLTTSSSFSPSSGSVSESKMYDEVQLITDGSQAAL